LRLFVAGSERERAGFSCSVEQCSSAHVDERRPAISNEEEEVDGGGHRRRLNLQSTRQAAKSAQVAQGYARHAAIFLEHAPDLVDDVGFKVGPNLGRLDSNQYGSTSTLGDLESIRLAPAQNMDRAAWRGLLGHGDQLLERGVSNRLTHPIGVPVLCSLAD
jgi:hypothetical protein